MKKGILTFAVMCFYGPVAVIACSSSSSSGGGGGSVTSIDSSKQAGSLSDAEKQQYCKDATNYINSNVSDTDSKKVSCFSKAVQSIYTSGSPPTSDADLQSKCKSAYNDCMSKPLDKGDAGTSTSSSCSPSEFTNCTATVGELNQCVQDSVAAMKTAYATFDTACDKIQMDGGGLQQSASSEPASCKALETKCPGMKSSTSGSGTGG